MDTEYTVTSSHAYCEHQRVKSGSIYGSRGSLWRKRDRDIDDNASTHSPPSVVMSQYTFKGLPRFSGSIQYSPSSVAALLSRMSLHDLPGFAFSPSLIS